MRNNIYSANQPIAVVFDCYINGLGVIRSLGEKNVPVLGLDHNSRNIGRFSHYCQALISPDPSKSEEKFIEFLTFIGRKFKTKAVLFPMNDEWLISVAKYRNLLDKYYLYPMANWEVIQNCINKKILYRIAADNDIPVPQTFFEEDIKANVSFVEKIKYPCVMKVSLSSEDYSDFRSKFGKSIFKVFNKKELLEKLKIINELKYDFVIQEIVPGGMDSLYTFGSFFNEKLEPLAVFTGRKIRQEPAEFGTCLLGESLYEPEIIRLGTKLIKALGYYGISQVEFKKDTRNGEFKLMELNARSWKWISLATTCGINLPYIAYLNSIGEKEEKIRIQSYGQKWILTVLDFYHSIIGYGLKGMSQYKLSIFQWIKSIKGKKVDGIFSIKDPLPGLFHIINIIILIFSKTYEYLFKKRNQKNAVR